MLRTPLPGLPACLILLLLHAAAVAEQPPTPVLSDQPVTQFALGAPAGTTTRSVVAAQHPAFDQALRIAVVQKPEHIHQIQINPQNAVALPAGVTLQVQLTLRSADPDGAPAHAHLFVQDRAQGFRSLFDRQITAGSNWEEVLLTFPIPEDLQPGRIQFSLMLGSRIQTVEIGRLEVVNLGRDPDLSRVRPDLRRTISVQGEYQPIASPRPTITGSLPAGWEEDSSWANVAVRYLPQRNNPHSGDRALRVEVGRVTQGAVQFRVPQVPVFASHMIRLRIPIRSEDQRTVTVTLRQREAPYRAYWSAEAPARPEWGVVELLASVAHTDPDAVLKFSMTAPGHVEIGDVELEYLTPQQALAGRSFEGNLLTTSSFPLGLTAPWACGANGTTEEHLRPDPEMRGPSGLPSLRLVPHRYEGRPMMQITSPFIGRPGTPHTLSFWARSDKPGMLLHLRMGPPGAQLWTGDWQKNVELTDQWQRYEHTVLLPPAPDLLYLARLTSHDTGTFWIDQVQVEAADHAGEFRRSDTVEIQLAADRSYGLSLEGEPLMFHVAVFGQIDQAHTLRGSILDLYGRETPLLTGYRLRPSGGMVRLRAAATLPDPQALGSFLITMEVLDRQGQVISKPAELLLHRVRQPRSPGRALENSPFGTHVTHTHENLRMAKALGFHWNRAHYGFNWTALQQADGSWNMAGADHILDLHRRNHLLVLTHFGGIPLQWSAVAPHWAGSNSWYRVTAAPRPEAMDAFEAYCRQLLQHAGRRLHAVEVWNEPFLPGFFVGDVQDGRPIRAEPELMLEMMRRARRAADQTGFRGKLLWNVGPHYGASEKAFDHAIRDAGGTDLVDGLTFHRYTNVHLGFPGDQLASDLEQIRESFQGHAAVRHIWNSEGGFGLSELFNLYRHVPPFGLRQRADMQASQYVRYVLSNLAAGAERVFVYNFFPQDGWVSGYSYMNIDGRLSQIAPAASNLAWHLEGMTFSEMRLIQPGVYAQLYRGSGGQTMVLLPNGRGPAVLHRLPNTIQVADLYGNRPNLPAGFATGVLYLRSRTLDWDTVANLLTPQDQPPPQ